MTFLRLSSLSLVVALGAAVLAGPFAMAETEAPKKAPRPSLRDAIARPMNTTAGSIDTTGSEASAKDGIRPSTGLDVFERMGAALPALPSEKTFSGVVDEAYGHYQRGEYVQALEKALKRAEAGDRVAKELATPSRS